MIFLPLLECAVSPACQDLLVFWPACMVCGDQLYCVMPAGIGAYFPPSIALCLSCFFNKRIVLAAE